MHTLLLTFLLILAAYGCSSLPGYKPSKTTSPTAELQDRWNRYYELAKASPHTGEGDWVEDDNCDALLFNSLLQVGSGLPIDIELAQSSRTEGRWYRNPSHTGCSSDISRDMLIGLLVWAYHNERLDILEGLWDYGSSNAWKMGRELSGRTDTRTILTPNLIGLLARAIYNLGGEKHLARHTAPSYKVVPGYKSHLIMLQILLDGRIAEGITEEQLEALESIAAESPENALAQALLHKYTDGDQTIATKLLLDKWPVDRLPNTERDWCDHWRVQRADGDSGLQPCRDGEYQEHSGGDLLFTAGLILGRV